MKTVAIIQSNYIPWRGYFDIIHDVDEFILYDDMQYTRRDWRNRNQIKTPQGLLWLSVPVQVKGKFFQKINETTLENHDWAKNHFQTIQSFYSKSPFWKEYKEWLIELYSKAAECCIISDVNEMFLHAICQKLNIVTLFTHSSDYHLLEGQTEKLVGLCKDAGATRYISGPAAKDYVVPDLFEAENIELVWKDYYGYPEYPQLYGEFIPNVSILDLLLNVGDKAPDYIWGWRTNY
jgi:hypothetical protein